jgi:hypothetical protein
LLLELSVLVMEALLPEENLLEVLEPASPFDCVDSVESNCISLLSCPFFPWVQAIEKIF